VIGAGGGILGALLGSTEEAAEFRPLAGSMVERHREMFPALHAERRERCASTGG
jgi:hypothetical protein